MNVEKKGYIADVVAYDMSNPFNITRILFERYVSIISVILFNDSTIA